jgi:hypothetical protein
MLDLSRVPLVDNHSHAGLYERRLGRVQGLADLEGRDPHYATSTYRALLRQACEDLYGDESRWADGVHAQYSDGVEAAYSRLLERVGVWATLWDFRRLGRDGWPEDRFRLIYWIDPFICPFADAAFWRGEDLQAALFEALALAGLSRLPGTFDEYLAFVEATLRGNRARLRGLKLALGYQRSLTFQTVERAAANRAYASLLRSEPAAYRDLQDFLVRWLFHLAGDLDLPLQIHASFGGPGSRLRLANNDPAQLQPLLDDPNNGDTRVVLLHGAYPFVSHAAVLAWNYPRVWLDFSVLPTLFTAALARWLAEWIELLPRNKLLFGSDASSPEEYYTGAVNGRRQLGVALDNLCQSGTLSRAMAMHVAERVCFRNALELYGLGDLEERTLRTESGRNLV